MRPIPAVLCALALACACGTPSNPDAAVGDAGDRLDAGADAASGTDAGVADAGTDAGVDAFVPPPPCTYDDLRAPPAGSAVLWPDVLNGSGADTLGGHGHDDGRGPIGFCAGTPVAGEPFFRLVAVGFETDTDITGDGDDGDALAVDFWRDASSFVGVGESAGRINVYVEVVDEDGDVLDRNTAPDVRIVREIRDGPTDTFGLDDKPDDEFQTNFPMTGGGTIYGVRMEGASDRVLNMRLPVNHHVTFALVFRRELP